MEEKGREFGAAPASAATTITGTATTTTSRTPEVVVVEQTIRRRGGGLKRKANNNNTSGISSSASKRLAKEKHLLPLPSLHNGPCTRARQSPNKLAASVAAAAAAGVAVPQNPYEAATPSVSSAIGEVIIANGESNPVSEAWQALEPVIDAEFEAIKSRDANVHVVPTPAGWFSWTKVHPLEERALPSFFDGKSENRTPDIYMEIRNSIMKRFHADPKTQVELKDLSELSVGELDARQDVMEFLDHWGLINFHPFPPTDSVSANTETDGAAKLASLIEKLYQFESIHTHPRVGARTNLSTPAMPPRLFPEATISVDLVKPEGPSVEYHCNSCSADCSRKRYHCQTQADFDLCSECYNNGKFGSGMSSTDFILMEPAEVPGIIGGSWSDQETLLLLEALELYGENWSEIAEHVATKTKDQCILHFVQMPIEDSFLDGEEELLDANPQGNKDASNNNSSEDAPKRTEEKDAANQEPSLSSPVDLSKPKGSSEVKDDQETGANFALNALKEAFQMVGSLPEPGGSLSFAESGNPVMTLVAFLTGLVEHDVAAASTRSSLKAISEGSGIHLATRHCFILEDPPEERMDPPDSERVIADVVDGEAQKDENQNKEQQKVENEMSDVDGTNVSKDDSNIKIEDTVLEEKESLVSSNNDGTEKSQASKEQDKVTTQEDSMPSDVKELPDTVLPGKDPPNTEKDSGVVALPVEVNACSNKESGDVASVEEVIPCSETPKAVDMVSDSASLEDKASQPVVALSQPVVASNSTTETGANAAEAPKVVDMASGPVSIEVEVSQPLDASNLTAETGANPGGDDIKLEDCKKEQNCNLTETKGDQTVNKIKRSAITALSAAAVKAKLLVNQEEDQIRQLATFLIEKQLHKLETKLSFFTDMESVIMRVREQLDRSRQRLYHERAQIIASRLGSASSSRAMPPSTNKNLLNHASSVQKLPGSMMPQNLPAKRTTLMSASSLSTSSVPSTVPGNSSRPSSVGTYQ